MSDGSTIEWTDATWQPITGCSIVSPGCTNCYAMKLAGTRLRHHPSRAGLTIDTKAGPVWNGEVRFNEQWLLQPLQWRKPRTIFVCAHGDLFHESVPDEWIDNVFAVMALCPQHTFQVLTKRAKRMREYLTEPLQHNRMELAAEAIQPSVGKPFSPKHVLPRILPNCWLGVSTERQQEYDERWPDLANTPASVRFISYEPALGPLNIQSMALVLDSPARMFPDWVICGGESGPGARPMHPDWARSVRDQCSTVGVPFFFKQWGAYQPNFPQYADEFGMEEGDMLCDGYDFPAEGVLYRSGHFYDGVQYQPHTGVGAYWMSRVGKKAAGRHLDGKLHDDMPQQRADGKTNTTELERRR